MPPYSEYATVCYTTMMCLYIFDESLPWTVIISSHSNGFIFATVSQTVRPCLTVLCTYQIESIVVADNINPEGACNGAAK